MAKTNNLHDFLVDLANTIRTKKKYPDSQKINPQDFSDEIDGISGGGGASLLLSVNKVANKDTVLNIQYGLTIEKKEV